MLTGTVWLACLISAAGAPPAADSFLNDRNFSIPIQIDDARRKDIANLELHVSTDEGNTWLPHANVTPEVTKFDFVAPKDGLYWFSVGLVDKMGNRVPASPFAVPPAMRVYVDTVPPKAALVSAVRQGDEVVVTWSLDEQFPHPGRSRLEFHTANMPANTWNPAPVLNFNPIDLRASFRPNSNYALSVRLHVEDLAGNVVDTLPLDVAGDPAPPAGPVAGPAPAPYAPPTPFQKTDTNWGQATAPAPVQPRPLEPDYPPSTSGSPYPPTGGIPLPPRPIVASSISAKPTQQDVYRTVSSPSSPPPAAVGVSALPPLAYVNTPQVMLEYKVGQLGLSGISEVQVFVTQDDGRTWQPWPRVQHQGPATEVDPGRGQDVIRRVLQVDLPGEGIYGMYLVVKSGVGKSQPPPAPGTPPQVRFEVDLQEPRAELFAPDIVLDKKDAVVLIWDAKDRNLTDTPIALEWAEHPNGPWEGIGPAELPNNPSRFTWQVPPKVPPRVYLRLRVRDRAGNVGVAQTPEPVAIDLNTPKVIDVGVVQVSSQVPAPPATPPATTQPGPAIVPHSVQVQPAPGQ